MAIANSDGSIVLTTKVDQSGLNKGMTSMQNGVKSLSSSFKALGSTIAAVFGITAIIKFSKQAGELATQTEASIQRLIDIYGEAAQSVGDFIDANARAIGMSKASAASFASVYGNLFSVWADQATNAELTNRYLNMTAVVASKTGRTVEDVQERIRSGLLGNTEAIEDLGVFVNVKTIEMTDAFQRMASGRSWEQLDAYTQQQIRSMAILEQATEKYGNTVADTTATARSQFQAAYEDFKNTWGQVVNTVLIPVLNILTQVFTVATKGLQVIAGLSGKTVENSAQTSNNIKQQTKEQEKLNKAVKEGQKNFSGLDEISVWDSGGGSPAALFETPDISKDAALSPLTGAFEVTKGAIEKINPTLSDLGEAITNIFQILGDMINTLLPPLVDIMAALMSILTQIINTLLPPIRDTLNAIMPIIAQVVSVLLPPLTTILTMVVGLIGQLLAAVMPIITQLADILMPVLTEIIGAVMPVLVQLFDAIVPVITRIAEAILPVVSSLLSLISSVLSALLPILQPILDLIMSLLSPLMTLLDVILTPIEAALKALGRVINNVVAPAIKWLIEKCVEKLTQRFNALKSVVNVIGGVFKTVWNSIKSVWQGAYTFFANIFAQIWSSINGTLTKIKNAFVNVFNGIKDAIKTPINGIIGFINKLIGGVTEGLNSVIKAMNNLSFDIPDWVPGLGGKTFGFDIKPLPVKKIPLLASGAVIPPNAPFMAVLGDQKHGTNVEAPLETIKQALREVIGSGAGGGNTYNITATANGKTLFQLLLEEGRNAQMQTGKNPFLLA